METITNFIINIIANAENSFADWMIFVSFTAIVILAFFWCWCTVGEKILNKFNLDKFFEDEQY